MTNATKIGIGLASITAVALLAKGGKVIPRSAASVVAPAIALYNQFKGIKETDPRLEELIYQMFRYVGWSDAKSKEAVRKQTPWSAVGISYALKQFPDFPKSASHSYFIVDARTNYKSNPPTGNWHLRGIHAYKPQVGDIVCKGRAGRSYTYQSIKKGDPSHTDLVIGVTNTHLVTIGFNVGNGIAITNVPLKNGYINHSNYFATIQNKHVNP
ncbi:MAG: DUF2272 domain-containing protein [Putridiphycobacter sp.]|nr:DUF2272 domain-containing protein [Putridiphycobacter sp.]